MEYNPPAINWHGVILRNSIKLSVLLHLEESTYQHES